MLRQLIRSFTHDRRWLWLFVAINVAGAAYGFYWYKSQLASTPPVAWIIVADSPLSCLYLAVAQLGWLRGRRYPLFEGLGYLGMMVYGFWTTFVLGLWGVTGGGMLFSDYMLILSHVGMFLEGLVCLLGRGTEYWAAGVAAAWLFMDHYFDYFHGFYPDFPNTEYLAFVRNVTFAATAALTLLMLVVIRRRIATRGAEYSSTGG